MTNTMRNYFQRSQSKVWFGNNAPSYLYYNEFYSLPVIRKDSSFKLLRSDNFNTPDLENFEKTLLNVSNLSNFSPSNRQGSPSSHKSQDSGFSDAETSKNSTNASPATPNTKSNVINQGSPCDSDTTVATPPTVIRRYVKPIYEEIQSNRRISFSAPSSPQSMKKSNSPNLLQPLDDTSLPSASLGGGLKNRSLKRNKVITKNSKGSRCIMGSFMDELPNSNNEQDENVSRKKLSNQNETVFLGNYNNNNNSFEYNIDSNQLPDTPLYVKPNYPATSTPKKSSTLKMPSTPILSTNVINSENSASSDNQDRYKQILNELRLLIPKSYCYMNPLLNGNMESVQAWLDTISCQSEVMSTLQNKSVCAAVKKNASLTSPIAVQVIKWLQKKVFLLQVEFENLERLFDSNNDKSFSQIPSKILNLASSVLDFVIKQESHRKFYSGDPVILNKFLDNIRSIREMATDLKVLTVKIDAESMGDLINSSIEEDVGILKRYFLVTTRLMFEQLIRVIVDSIEETNSVLILHSNLMYVAQLSNFDLNSGFASLNDGFVTNGTVRVLLSVCFESKNHTKTRALALRALSTLCSTNETIQQFEMEGGVEILKDILTLNIEQRIERSEQEIREAVSVLTQITAPWHTSQQYLEGLKEFSEGIVEAVLDLITRTTCCQTILLGSAFLNNISRIEPISIYSLMSHDCVLKLKLACDGRGPMTSIFIYEQITSMMLNMSSNKKSHHYLSDKHIISFLILSFQMKFSQKYSTSAENIALKKTLQNIMEILFRLIDAAIVSQDVLNNTVIPVFLKIERNLKIDSLHYHNILMMNEKLLKSKSNVNFKNIISINRNRQQSFV